MLAIGAGLLQDGLHYSVIGDNCDMTAIEINKEMMNPPDNSKALSLALKYHNYSPLVTRSGWHKSLGATIRLAASDTRQLLDPRWIHLSPA